MDVCSLYPPNIQSLSECVIGDVMQRPQRSNDRRSWEASVTRAYMGMETVVTERSRPISQSAGSSDMTMLLLSSNHPAATTAKRTRANKHKDKASLGLPPTHNDSPADVRKNRRRERCRLNEARYRKRQRKLAEDLEDDVRRLKDDVLELEKERSSIPVKAPMKHQVWIVMTEFLQRFCSTPIDRAMPTADLNFLRATMAPNVRYGDACGVGVLLENRRLFAVYFSGFRIDLGRMEMIADNSLMATTTTTIKISENTLRYVFPHLNSDGHGGATGGEWSPLTARLLGQKIAMRGSMRFDWDESTGRVANIQSQADLLTPMKELLGNLRDVSKVFEGARVTPDGKIR